MCTRKVFFDEIQVVEKWEEAINSFFLDFPSDIYITGSNSQLLSAGLSTLLTGRYIHIQMQTLSFQEMVAFNSDKTNNQTKNDLLWLYIRRGGFLAIHLTDYDERAAYLIISNIYDSMVLHDVVQRYNIRNIEILNRVMQFIMDSVGSTVAAKKLPIILKVNIGL